MKAFPGIRILLFFLFFPVLTGCKPETQVPSHKGGEESEVNRELMQINRYIVKRNQELIRSFVKRTGWDMQNTGTGLWFMVTHHGTGPSVSEGKEVFFSFREYLLDGEAVDSASAYHPRSFVVGHGGVEAGLEEGMKYLHEGDKARFIIPPHLAYGTFGASGDIPSGAILLYELKLLAVK